MVKTVYAARSRYRITGSLRKSLVVFRLTGAKSAQAFASAEIEEINAACYEKEFAL
jgi:hypothetical protein